jgi:hypothetical protein
MLDDKYIIGGGILLVAAIFSFAFYMMIAEANEWREFAIKHNCKIVEQMKGSTSTGFGPTVSTSGDVGMSMMVISNSGKVCYQCDDGKRYWREG